MEDTTKARGNTTVTFVPGTQQQLTEAPWQTCDETSESASSHALRPRSSTMRSKKKRRRSKRSKGHRSRHSSLNRASNATHETNTPNESPPLLCIEYKPLDDVVVKHDEEKTEVGAVEPWSPVAVSSPLSQHTEDLISRDPGQESNKPIQAHKSIVRFGATVVKDMSAVTSSLDSIRKPVIIILVAITVGIVGGGILLLSNKTVNGTTHLGDCRSLSCRHAKSDVGRLFDFSVEPCRDFYDHVCHRWDELNTGPAGEGPVNFLRANAAEFLKHVNATLSSVKVVKSAASGALQGLSKFYRSCERFVSAPVLSLSDAVRPFREYGDEVFGLTSFPDVLRHVVELSLARGIHTVLEIRLSTYPDVVILRILRGQTLSQKVGIKDTLPLRDYLKELLDEVFRMHGDRAFDVTSVLENERSLSNYMTHKGQEERRSVAVLKQLTADVRYSAWLDMLNARLPNRYRLDSRSLISIDSVDLIRQLLGFLRSLVDYGVVYLYIQILLDAFRFDYLRRVSSSHPESAVSSCLRATRLVMRDASNAIAAHFFPKQRVHDLALRTTSAVLKSLSRGDSFAWLNDAMKGEAGRTLQDIRMHNFSASSKSEPFDGELDLGRPSAVAKFPSLFIYLKRRQQWGLLEDPPAPQEGAASDAFLSGNEVLYEPLSNSFVLPAYLLREPILYAEDDVPPEYAMGSLGVLLARALHSALLGSASGLWSTEDRLRLSLFEQCMDIQARSVLNVSLDHHEDEDVPEIYAWAHGARTAFMALKETYSRRGNSTEEVADWHSARKTFFRRFCLLSCGEKRKLQRLASRVLCFIPLLNMPEFVEVFGCSHMPEVYTGNYCTMWSLGTV
ncbi:hypothetical protein HPB50_021377 [Hyalomma asiaticum]|uniref:Uncharacterized protein n=1 Tax=Hyalomma asiaticum TaxID=266040 RepID=A0ACB7SXZ7_HYAAI|nr:hypothetical protein HPB50_021377 [Hyalomma asiaticum]